MRNRGSLFGVVVAMVLAWPAVAAETVPTAAPAPAPKPPAPAATVEALNSDEVVRRAGGLIADGKRAEAIGLLEDHLQRTPTDDAARQALLAARIAQLEQEIRTILAAEASTRDLAVGPPDYEAVKARSEEVVKRRLEVAEYFAAAGRPGEAIEACDAILKDHVGHPAPLALKWRMLKELLAAVMVERKALLREKDVRHAELINEVIDKAIMPREKDKVARGVVIFEEDVAEVERERVRSRLRERVSLENMSNVEVRKMVETMFAIAGINYIILDSALGSETLSFNVVDESLDNILQIISRQVGLRYNYIAGTVYISSATSTVLETAIIRLQSGLTDVLAQPKSSAGGAEGAGGNGGAGGPNLPPQAQPDPFAQQGGEKEKSDLERFLDKVPDIIVGWPAEGTIYLDRKSNSVFVRATPAAIAEVKRLLQSLDYNSVQVLIEARFVEVGENDLFTLGIDWSGRYTTKDGRYGAEGGTNTGGGTVNSPLGNPPNSSGLSPGLLISGIAGDQTANFLGASIRALEEKGKADTLAEPKILTLNNATGFISLTNDVSFVAKQEFQTQNSNSAVNNGTVVTSSTSVLVPTVETQQEVISLLITPSVARNSNIITLHLQPRVRQLVRLNRFDFTYAPGGGAAQIPAFNQKPDFDDRKLETTLHIQSGQTVALGGLVKELDMKTTTGLPFISRVPLLGRFFRTDKSDTRRRNLVIFVSAQLVEPNGAHVGDEVRLLRDSATISLTPPVRAAVDQRAREEAASRAAEAGSPALPQKGRGR